MTVSSGGALACYKCMTTNTKSDYCRDPFSSILNPIQLNCQASSLRKNGIFPARFCAKISGRVTSISGDANKSYVNTHLYYRTCIIDNILQSTHSLETSGYFRLKGISDINGTLLLKGSISICTTDGCNFAINSRISWPTFVVVAAILIDQSLYSNQNTEK